MLPQWNSADVSMNVITECLSDDAVEKSAISIESNQIKFYYKPTYM